MQTKSVLADKAATLLLKILSWRHSGKEKNESKDDQHKKS